MAKAKTHKYTKCDIRKAYKRGQEDEARRAQATINLLKKATLVMWEGVTIGLDKRVPINGIIIPFTMAEKMIKILKRANPKSINAKRLQELLTKSRWVSYNPEKKQAFLFRQTAIHAE